ncbi:MAG: hypothetical protein HY741_11065 [Chloroflexi bacterium]|nr:hypothetical protein [Chloroflexota bacterium]
MATLKIEPAPDGKVWVTLAHFGEPELTRLKKIPGARGNADFSTQNTREKSHSMNPERKQSQVITLSVHRARSVMTCEWSLPDTPATRAALAEIVAMPPAPAAANPRRETPAE